jgi:hypothetical protein
LMFYDRYYLIPTKKIEKHDIHNYARY